MSYGKEIRADFYRIVTDPVRLRRCGLRPVSHDQVIVSIASEPETLDPCQGWGHGTTPLVQSTLLEYNRDMTFSNDQSADYSLSEDGLAWTSI